MREDFNPQVGDTVRIRCWDDMASEFGVRKNGSIDCQFAFTNEMKYLCGREFTILEINHGNYGIRTCDGYSISKDMIEPIVEEVEYEKSEEIESFLNEYMIVV